MKVIGKWEMIQTNIYIQMIHENRHIRWNRGGLVKKHNRTRQEQFDWNFVFIRNNYTRIKEIFDWCVFIFIRIKKGEGRGKENVTLKL